MKPKKEEAKPDVVATAEGTCAFPSLDRLLAMRPHIFKAAYPKNTSEIHQEFVALQKAGFVYPPHKCSNPEHSINKNKETQPDALAQFSGAMTALVGDTEKLTDEQLGQRVGRAAAVWTKWGEDLIVQVKELRARFRRKPQAATICGCRTWEQYCDKYFRRTRRAVDYFLSGGNPVSKRKPAEAQPEPLIANVRVVKHTVRIPYTSIRFVRDTVPVEGTEQPQQEYKTVSVSVSGSNPEQRNEETVSVSRPSVQDVASNRIRQVKADVEADRQRLDPSDRPEFDRLIAQGLAEEFNYFPLASTP